MFVIPEHIRETGRTVAREGDRWVEDLQPLRRAPARFGTHRVSQMLNEFHATVHDVSLTYYQEVGECCGDVGIGLIHVADLYADTERDNATTALLVAKEIANIGAF